MKTTKFAFISFAFILSFGIQFLVTYNFFFHNTFFERYFFQSALATGVYFLLALFTFGFLVFEPHQFLKADIQNKKTLVNWSWHIYLSGWILLLVVIIQNYLNFIPDKIRNDFFEFSMVFFLIKGFFLIPAHIVNTQWNDISKRLPVPIFIFLEVILVLFIAALLYVAGNAVPDFGE